MAEAFLWVGIIWIGPSFLAFALAYTGRTKALYSRGFQILTSLPIFSTILCLTYPFHSLLWTDFEISAVFGLATVLYTIQPVGYLIAITSLVAVGIGVLLLLETIMSYGPLYKREAFAVAISTLPPAVGFIIWLLGVGPWPEVNLALLLLLPHTMLDAYAFVGTHMFETAPVTQRAAEQRGLNTLNTPILTIDAVEQVVDLNDYAKKVFEIDSSDVLPIPLVDLTGMSLDKLRSTGELKIDGEEGGIFVVSYSSLSGPGGGSVGGILTLSDIIDERQRKQQLDVLNRILRHNLRNEMTVIQGRAELIISEAPDSKLSNHGGTIVESSDRLLSIAEKMRDFDRMQSQGNEFVPVDIADVLRGITNEIRNEFPSAAITVDIEVSEATVKTDGGRLELILTNLIENAIVHAEKTPVEVSVSVYDAESEGDGVSLRVRDSNEPISEEEIAPLKLGNETALQHGSGIGLWLVKWCLVSIGGEIEFDYDEGNVVTVTLQNG